MKSELDRKAFSIVELMVVILIVGILAAATVPIFRAKTRRAEWSEAAASAGSIRQALRAYYAEDPVGAAAMAGSTVDTVQVTLGFRDGDLTGRYFQASDFTIAAIDGNGLATITVAAPAGLSGSGVLSNAGWVYTP
jgi:prepilin-type N-terminal cleavage/methylation domain-containing protein